MGSLTLTSQVAAGTALVANFAAGAVVLSRETTRIFVDPYGLSTGNKVRVLCGGAARARHAPPPPRS